MLHNANALLFIVLGYFIVVVVFLAIFWRIAMALDTIAQHLLEIARDLKKLISSSGKE